MNDRPFTCESDILRHGHKRCCIQHTRPNRPTARSSNALSANEDLSGENNMNVVVAEGLMGFGNAVAMISFDL